MSERLVILPGLLCDSRMFVGQVEAFDALVMDGFYGRANRIEAMADFALDRLPARCALLGHSMGARVALEIWRRAPERIERLALADTGVHVVRPGEADKRYALRDLGRREGCAVMVDQWLPPMIGKERRQDADLYAALRAMSVDAGMATFEAQIDAMLHRPEVESLLPSINCPAFAIVGSDDEWSPVAQHEDIVAAIPGAQLRIVAGVGHMAPAEDPVRFNDSVREWLNWMPARTFQQAR